MPILPFVSCFQTSSMPTTLDFNLGDRRGLLGLRWIWWVLFIIQDSFDFQIEWIFDVFEWIEEMFFVVHNVRFWESHCLQPFCISQHFFIVEVDQIWLEINWIFKLWVNWLVFIQETTLVAEIIRLNVFWIFQWLLWNQDSSWDQKLFKDCIKIECQNWFFNIFQKSSHFDCFLKWSIIESKTYQQHRSNRDLP